MSPCTSLGLRVTPFSLGRGNETFNVVTKLNTGTCLKWKNTRHKKKPNLAGIQEFGAAAYVKDLKAGKLDAQAKVGRFVGYDSESKGYRIYWPGKRLITVERNVVFNQNDVQTSDDTAIIHGEMQSEGERDKVIQPPQNNVENPENEEPNEQNTQDRAVEPYQSPKLSNSIPFPLTPGAQIDLEPEVNDNDEPQQYGCGQRQRHPVGTYKAMNEGLTAVITLLDDQEAQDDVSVEVLEADGYSNCFYLPPDVAMLGHYGADPKTLDEALRAPNAKQWQEALDYEISQLEKLGTWVVETLPQGKTAIPCSEVIKVKQGPNGEIQSYRVRIVAGGHRQVEGVNYTKTFSATAKMPTVRVVLANAAHQDWEIEHIDVKVHILMHR